MHRRNGSSQACYHHTTEPGMRFRRWYELLLGKCSLKYYFMIYILKLCHQGHMWADRHNVCEEQLDIFFSIISFFSKAIKHGVCFLLSSGTISKAQSSLRAETKSRCLYHPVIHAIDITGCHVLGVLLDQPISSPCSCILRLVLVWWSLFVF